MSLDTRYRPRHFYDVLGQENHIKILRRFVATGKGRHQSYLFAGPFGSGKTTLGRILARALLCSNPLKEDEKAEEGAGTYREGLTLRHAGDPCDECSTCKSFLQGQGASEFIEVDAATNTGKSDIVALTEEIQFATFSGRHRIYLFDECFTEDTLVMTEDGPLNIRVLVEQKNQARVRARNLTTGEDIWVDVINWFNHGDREVLEMDFGDGLILCVTESQLFFTENRGWVEAKDLTCQDEVLSVKMGECQLTLP